MKIITVMRIKYRRKNLEIIEREFENRREIVGFIKDTEEMITLGKTFGEVVDKMKLKIDEWWKLEEERIERENKELGDYF